MIESVEISGLRGFATAQRLKFGVPDGREGSGLTILVGPNNSGKSTVIESLHFLQRRDVSPSFGPARRNGSARGRVSIKFEDPQGRVALLGTDPAGGGDVIWRQMTLSLPRGTPFVLPSRRALSEPSFQNSPVDRAEYLKYTQPGDIRSPNRPAFGSRLVRMHQNRGAIDAILSRILDEVPDWTVEPGPDGQHALRIYTAGSSHPSEGVGEGVTSLLFIADALYDSEPGFTVVIDEPELSIHPATQRRLASVLEQFAVDRQIVIATHSPHFANWSAVLNGASVARVHRVSGQSRISSIRSETVERIRSFVNDYGNPHILGLEAREVFFLSDRVILVEGQEDVIGFGLIAESVGALTGDFYGWGVGGATKMGTIAAVLRDLGFEKVVGILDLGMDRLAEELNAEFPNYSFLISPAPDVRTKPARDATPSKPGLLDAHWRLPPESEQVARQLFDHVNFALSNGPVRTSESPPNAATLTARGVVPNPAT